MSSFQKRLIGCLVSLCVLIGIIPFSASADTEPSYYGRDALSAMSDSRNYLYVYDKIAEGVKNKASEIDVAGLLYGVSVDDFDMVYDAYCYDHAEAFYVTGAYSYSYNTLTNTVTLFRPEYADFTAADQQRFDTALDTLYASAGITAGMSDYEKSLLLHDALSSHVTYDLTAPAMHTAYGALVNGRAVCDGYAEAYQCLLREAGITSHIVVGYSVNPSSGKGEGHAWNLVELDGEYYYTDVTWDDQGDDLYHAYLNVTEDTLTEDHMITEPLYGLPECTATTANYFTKNPHLVTTATGDVDQMVSLLRQKGVARVYVIGDNPANIWTWYKANVSTIAGELGVTGQYSYGASYLAREFHLTLTWKSQPPISVAKPTAKTNLVYTGSVQTGVSNGTGYTLTGNTATGAGQYTAVATLKSGYVWADGSTGSVEIPWEIRKAEGEITLAVVDHGRLTVTLPDTFDPMVTLNIIVPEDGVPYLRYYTDEACSEGESDTPYTDVGTYWIKAFLEESNNYTAAESDAVSYTVLPKPVAPQYGRVDGDDEVRSADALIVLQYATARITLSDEELRNADVDGVDGVTSSDALLILQYATKKIGSFPIET